MSISEIINLVLYGISGFFFGIFASRNSVLAVGKIINNKRLYGLSGQLLWHSLFNLLFLLLAFFIFPVWFSSATTLGAFVYYVVLFYFFNMGYRKMMGK